MEGIDYEAIKCAVNLMQVASWLKEDIEAALSSQFELSHPEYEAMMQLLQHESRLPLSELAELVIFSQSGITRLLDRLERKGLAKRELSATDRRVIYASLSKKGREKLEKAMPVIRKVIDERFARHISRVDIADLRKILLEILRGNGWWDERQVSHQSSEEEAAAGARNG